jgi:hypothetical protein
MPARVETSEQRAPMLDAESAEWISALSGR